MPINFMLSEQNRMVRPASYILYGIVELSDIALKETEEHAELRRET